jgi:hypothetical protein
VTVISLLSPAVNTVVYKGVQQTISWSTNAVVQSFTIELYNTDKTKYPNLFVNSIVTNYNDTLRSFVWSVPTTLASSRYYYVRVWGYLDAGSGQLDTIESGYSSFFTIQSSGSK